MLLSYKNNSQSYTEIKDKGEMYNLKKKKKKSLRRCEVPFWFRLICLSVKLAGDGERNEVRWGGEFEGWQLLLDSHWGL